MGAVFHSRIVCGWDFWENNMYIYLNDSSQIILFLMLSTQFIWNLFEARAAIRLPSPMPCTSRKTVWYPLEIADIVRMKMN